jgi:hypothetical protein
MVSAHGHHRVAQLQLQPTLFARLQLLHAQQADAPQRFGSAQEQFHFAVMQQRRGDILEEPEVQVDALGGMIFARMRQNVATQHLGEVNPRDVDCRPASRRSRFLLLLVRLQPADAAPFPRGQHLHFIANFEGPIHQRAGDHGSKSGDGKHPIDRQPRPAVIGPRLGLFQALGQRLAQLIQSGALAGRDAHHARVFQH